MTNEQHQLITLLFVKYGTFARIIDTWLYTDEKLSSDERDAVTAWISDSTIDKPFEIEIHDATEFRHLTIDLNVTPDVTD